MSFCESNIERIKFKFRDKVVPKLAQYQMEMDYDPYTLGLIFLAVFTLPESLFNSIVLIEYKNRNERFDFKTQIKR